MTLTLSMAPANASWVNNKSASDVDEGVTLYINYDRDSDGHGFHLNTVEISGCDNTCTGVTGNYLRCWNQNNVVKWSKDGSDINLSHSDAHVFSPNQNWTDATQLNCDYDGYKYDIPDWNGADHFHDVIYRT
jgi:hypothetical protein